ncbi:MAG: hypothetical protein DRO87_08500 [Candidatus Thorarchaeota archaeon]|nr:MAG: hypothetical protein DRO87_08500 [Candidatus Thorarchaeota archaeon]
MIQFRRPTYFIGYGSLMYPSGINGRGMRKNYDWPDLIPIKVKGFKRSFCSVFQDILAYYGVYRDETSEINAIAFEIKTQHDYEMLLRHEGSHPSYKHPMYNVVDVSDVVSGFDFPPDARIVILETAKIETEQGSLPYYYVSGVWEGIQHWGEEFCQTFLETGGLSPDGLDFDKNVRHPWRDDGVVKCAERG